MADRKEEFESAAKMEPQEESEADLRRGVFYQQDPGPPDVTYSPTQTSDHSNPRTSAMSFWAEEQVVRVEWGDGGQPYQYYGVSKEEWRRIVKSKSAGRAVNRILNNHPYGPV